MVDRACRLAFKDGFAKAGRRVIIVAGVPLGTPGATNMLRIAFVGAEVISGLQPNPLRPIPISRRPPFSSDNQLDPFTLLTS